MLVIATVWLLLWAAMAVSVVPVGRLTATGVLLVVLVPLPSWPEALLPQVKAVPAEVNATLWRRPAATAVISVPGARATLTGARASVVVPSPS